MIDSNNNVPNDAASIISAEQNNTSMPQQPNPSSDDFDLEQWVEQMKDEIAKLSPEQQKQIQSDLALIKSNALKAQDLKKRGSDDHWWKEYYRILQEYKDENKTRSLMKSYIPLSQWYYWFSSWDYPRQAKNAANKLQNDARSAFDAHTKQANEFKANTYNKITSMLNNLAKYKTEQDALKKVGITNPLYLLKNGVIGNPNNPASLSAGGWSSFASQKKDDDTDFMKIIEIILMFMSKLK